MTMPAQKFKADMPTRKVDEYLQRLEGALRRVDAGLREDIVQEIRAHIRDRVAEEGTDVEVVLADLGPASELARQYHAATLLRRASKSVSPLVVLRALYRWALTGLGGFFVFVVALIGYG